MIYENFSSRKTSESFTSAFQVQKKVPQIDADIGIVLVEPKFLADFVADDVMSFLLDVLADIFSFQTEGIEAAITNFPVSKFFVLKVSNKLWMAFFKDNFRGAEKFFPVGHQNFNLFFRTAVEFVVR